MSARRPTTLVALGLALALALLLGATDDRAIAPRRAVYPATFPPGTGMAIAERSCLFCHSAMLVTQQAKDSTGWEKTLATMEKWGAPVAKPEHDSLRVYLLEHFGPRPAK
jgi:cytochrome c5